MCAVCNWKTFSCSLNISYMYLFIQFMDMFVCDRLLLSPLCVTDYYYHLLDIIMVFYLNVSVVGLF